MLTQRQDCDALTLLGVRVCNSVVHSRRAAASAASCTSACVLG